MRCFITSLILATLATPAAFAQPVRELTEPSDAVFAVAFLHDGRRVAVGGEHEVAVWNLANLGAEERRLETEGRVMSLACSPDGRWLAAATAGGNVIVWDTTAEWKAKSFSGHYECAYSVAFTPDGSRVVSCGQDGTVRTWDLADGAASEPIHASEQPLYAVAVSPDGKLIASAGLDGVVRLHEVESGRRVGKLKGHTEAIFTVGFDPSGSRLVSGSGDRSIVIWDVTNREQTARWEAHLDAVYAVSFSRDAQHILSVSPSGEVVVWDAEDGNSLFGHRFPGKALSGSLAPDGLRIAVGTKPGACFILELPRHLR